MTEPRALHQAHVGHLPALVDSDNDELLKGDLFLSFLHPVSCTSCHPSLRGVSLTPCHQRRLSLPGCWLSSQCWWVKSRSDMLFLLCTGCVFSYHSRFYHMVVLFNFLCAILYELVGLFGSSGNTKHFLYELIIVASSLYAISLS